MGGGYSDVDYFASKSAHLLVNPITGGGGANRPPPGGFSDLYQKPFALAP